MNYFFYDGNCPFCAEMGEKLKRINLSSNIKITSFREMKKEELIQIHSELTLDALERDVQLIYEGARYPGFFGIRKLFPNLKGYRYFTPFLYIPLIPLAGMFLLMYLRNRRALKDKN